MHVTVSHMYDPMFMSNISHCLCVSATHPWAMWQMCLDGCTRHNVWRERISGLPVTCIHFLGSHNAAAAYTEQKQETQFAKASGHAQAVIE